MQQAILRLTAVKARTGWGTSYIYELVRRRKFPAPIKIGKRASGWIEAEVDAWIARRISETRAKPTEHQSSRNPRTGRWDKPDIPSAEATAQASSQEAA